MLDFNNNLQKQYSGTILLKSDYITQLILPDARKKRCKKKKKIE